VTGTDMVRYGQRREGFAERALSDALALVAERLDPQPSPWENDPVGWVNTVLREYVWSKQTEILESVRDHRYTAVKSCHDAGKSFIASRAAAWWIDAHPPQSAFVVSTAPTWPQVQAILWREIARAHSRGGLQGKVTLDCVWRLGSKQHGEIVGYGRKPADYNPDAFQGIHQKYVLVLIDEANGVPANLWDAVDTIVTNTYCRVLAIGNPDNPSSHFASVCKANSGWNVIRIDGFQTPNFTDEWVPEYLRDLLLSKEWVEERALRWGKNSPLYTSKVRGEFPIFSDDSLVPPAWLYDAVGRKIPGRTGREPGVMGLDIARTGQDRSVCYRQRGGYVSEVFKTGTGDLVELSEAMKEAMRGKPGLRAVGDEAGVGAGVIDIMQHDGFDIFGYNGGRTPRDTERFLNARSEDFWYLRERFQEGTISLPDDEDLINQLLQLKWRMNGRNKIEVETKDDYRKRTRAGSPDEADALMMAFIGEEMPMIRPEEHESVDSALTRSQLEPDGLNYGQSDPFNVLEVVW